MHMEKKKQIKKIVCRIGFTMPNWNHHKLPHKSPNDNLQRIDKPWPGGWCLSATYAKQPSQVNRQNFHITSLQPKHNICTRKQIQAQLVKPRKHVHMYASTFVDNLGVTTRDSWMDPPLFFELCRSGCSTGEEFFKIILNTPMPFLWSFISPMGGNDQTLYPVPPFPGTK